MPCGINAMKHLLRLTAALFLVTIASLSYAQAVQGIWVSQANIGQGFISPATLSANISTPLTPPIADGAFLCNNSGATAVPYACTVGTGLAFSSGVLSATNSYTFTIGSPSSRSVSLSTAYQATTNTKPAFVTLNLSSTASLSIAGGSTNTATVLIGSTSGVASGSGTTIATYTNSLTGTLVVGLAVNTNSVQTVSFALPQGWYFAVIQSSGTVSVTSAFDQSLS